MSQIKGGFPNEQAVQDALKARGMTLDHLQRQTKMSMEIDKVIEKGGDLGFLPKGQTDPAFELAAFALKPGELSNVVETPFGYHVIQVTEHRAARSAALQEVSGQIKEYLTGQQRDVQIQAFVEQAKGKRKVKILL